MKNTCLIMKISLDKTLFFFFLTKENENNFEDTMDDE